MRVMPCADGGSAPPPHCSFSAPGCRTPSRTSRPDTTSSTCRSQETTQNRTTRCTAHPDDAASQQLGTPDRVGIVDPHIHPPTPWQSARCLDPLSPPRPLGRRTRLRAPCRPRRAARHPHPCRDRPTGRCALGHRTDHRCRSDPTRHRRRRHRVSHRRLDVPHLARRHAATKTSTPTANRPTVDSSAASTRRDQSADFSINDRTTRSRPAARLAFTSTMSSARSAPNTGATAAGPSTGVIP